MAIEIKLSRIQFIIIQLLLWFYRIFGISFGGFSIDSKGRMYSNKWLKVYGLSLAIVMVVYDLYQYVWYFERHMTEAKDYESFKNAPDQIKIPIIVHASATQLAWFCFKTFSLILFNLKGFDIMKDLIEKFAIYRPFKKRNTKILIILIFWLCQIVINFVIVAKFKNFWRIIVWQLEFKMCTMYNLAIVVIAWIISIVYSSRLNQLLHDLKDFAEFQKIQGDNMQLVIASHN